MASSTVVLCAVVLLSVVFQAGEALNCYQCNGLVDKSCNNPYVPKAEHKKPCTDAKCTRLTVSNNQFANITMRTCGPAVWEKLSDIPLGNVFSKSSFNCTYDYCNESSNLGGSPLMLWISLSTIIFAFWMKN